MVGVVAQLVESGILLGRVDDLIRVVGRDADRGEYRAGPRVERNDRALAPAERVGRGLLDLEIDAQHDLSRGSAIAEVARFPDRDWVGRILADERVGVRGLYAGEAEFC